MKLKFIVDKDKDKLFIKAGSKEALSYIDEQYKTSSKFIKIAKDLYQKSWDEIDKDFSEYIEKTTGYKWFYPEYKCVVSVIFPGLPAWWDIPLIFRHWKENPYFMRRITAHELIMSHYIQIYKKYYKHEGLTDGQLWALAEIAAWALTSLTPEVKKFWPWNTKYYTDHNYPWIVKIQNKMKQIFLERKDFDEYIQEGIKIIKKYPHMSPLHKAYSLGNMLSRGVPKYQIRGESEKEFKYMR